MEELAYIEALGKALQQNLELSQEGNILINFEDTSLFIQWRNPMTAFQVQIPLGSPSSLGGGIFKQLLCANFLLHQTGGACLSYNEEVDTVFLEHIIPIQGMEVNEFVEQVEIFTQIAEMWTEKLHAMNRENIEYMAQNIAEFDKEIQEEAEHESDHVTLMRI